MKKKKLEGLKPCPLCGNDIIFTYEEGERYQVLCEHCKWVFVFRFNQWEGAKGYWNEIAKLLTKGKKNDRTF